MNWLLRRSHVLHFDSHILKLRCDGAVMFTFVGLSVLSAKQHAWTTSVHELELGAQTETEIAYPMGATPPTGHGNEEKKQPSQV
jgi:hypothetical protein